MLGCFFHVENVVVMRGVTGHTHVEPHGGVSFITGNIQAELLAARVTFKSNNF